MRLSIMGGTQAVLRFPRPLPPAVEPPVAPIQPQLRKLRESLVQSVGGRISSGSELIHTLEKNQRPVVPTMLAPFDRVLRGGLSRGKLTELIGRRSSGRFAVCLAALAAMTGCGEAAALVDHGDHLDPQMAEAAGVDLQRLLWVRPQTVKQAVAAAEMLITTGFSLVLIDLGVQLHGRRVVDASWVRLARAAEAYGAAVLISSPFSIAGTATEAAVSAHNGTPVWKGKGKSPRLLLRIESSLTLEKHRHAITGRSESLRLRHEEAIFAAESPEETSENRIEQFAAASA